jgi:hypothetical protein
MNFGVLKTRSSPCIPTAVAMLWRQTEEVSPFPSVDAALTERLISARPKYEVTTILSVENHQFQGTILGAQIIR